MTLLIPQCKKGKVYMKINHASQKFYCDLHSHSRLSDGKYSAEELIEAAIEKLGPNGVLAITDHDAVLESFSALKKKYADRITLVAGCEISAVHILSTGRSIDLHLNLLFFDPENQDFRDFLTTIDGNRDAFLSESLRVLEEKTTFRLSLPELKKRFPDCGMIGRKHLCVCLTEQGLYQTVSEALEQCLGRLKKPFCYVDASPFFPSFPDMQSVLDITKKIGALAVLNHPLFYGLSQPELKELIATFVKWCRERKIPHAMEIEYSDYDTAERDYLYSLKKPYPELLVSCGSDFHGWKNEQIEAFPGKIYTDLQKAHKNTPA